MMTSWLNIRRWTARNLFSSPLNSVLSLVGIGLFVLIVPPLLSWAVISADLSGTTAADCTREGACWVFIKVYLPQFIYGFYPDAERWRINLAIVLLIVLLAPLFFSRVRGKRFIVMALVCLYPVIAFYLFFGGAFGLTEVPTDKWGGLFLTLIVAVVGIVCAFPLGVILALGRRSELPVIRGVCSAFIEFWRGIPLITVLFMASVMLPLFLPGGVNVDKLLRALIGVVLFAGAYMAEVVRGGLQAIPKGQIEAAKALGLHYWQVTMFIVLPQALRHVIPGIVNTFIALFKDTTLVLIIGLFDLLGIIQAAATDPQWLGYAVEGYVFAAFVFWVFCFGMSLYSRRVEHSLGVGQRRD